MPSGPYPTAFGEPDPPTSTSAPTPHEPRRPLSPAPSYHTLPPSTHSSVSSNPDTAQLPPSTLPSTAPLLTAARATPDAVLSHLTILSHVQQPRANTKIASSSVLTAVTADGKARYRVTGSGPGTTEVVVLKVLGSHGVEEEEIASVLFSSRGLRVVEWSVDRGGGELGRRVKVGTLEVAYEELEGRRGMDVGMKVEGRDKGVRWEVVREEEEDVGGVGEHGSRRKSSDKKGLRGRFVNDEHEKRRQKERFTALRLVDREGNVYAEYRHEVGLPSPNQDEKWGQVSVMARAVLLDEGVDRAFITLVALLETFVKVFGQSKRENREWGNLAGSMACCVM